MESKFRLNAQSIFLTYPQCSLTPQETLSALQVILQKKKWGLTQWIIAQELHEDGHPHIHAWLNLDKKVNIGDPKLFDLQTFHPNM